MIGYNIDEPFDQVVTCKTELIARLAQSVEHETLNLGVVGSSPTLGVFLLLSQTDA